MKFNWKANWEILLVLVIIVVGIVITTIAAIKNKDKHLLVQPEETDLIQFMGQQQLLPTAPIASVNEFNAVHSTAAPSLIVDSNSNSNNLMNLPIDSGNHNGNEAKIHQRNVKSIVNSNKLISQTTSASFQPSTYKAEPMRSLISNHQLRNSQKELFNPLANNNNQATTGSAQDIYDASSTEASAREFIEQNYANKLNSGSSNFFLPIEERRIFNKTASGSQLNQGQLNSISSADNANHNYSNEQLNLDQTSDLMDDIHTTRSSLATRQNFHPQQGNLFQLGPTAQPNLLDANNNQQQTSLTTQPLVLHGPYSVVTPPVGQMGPKLFSLNAANSRDSDGEEMMTSYSRIPINSNPGSDNLQNQTDLPGANHNSQLLGSAMLANLIASMPPNQSTGGSESEGLAPASSLSAANDPFQLSSGNPQQKTTQLHHNKASSMPISVILSDLLKLARPQQLINSLSNGVQENGGSSARPQSSILQQLRSLPSPLVSLIQSMGQQSQQQQQQQHLNSNQDDPYNNQANHDASESSQHYHRISISPADIKSILTHSLRSTGVLPAFPPPKGTQQSWIPPTSGGNPSYHDALNSNSDFVAKNVAGFVRSQTPGESQSGFAANQLENENYQRISNEEPAQPINGESLNDRRTNKQPNLYSSNLMDVQQHQQQQQSDNNNGNSNSMNELPPRQEANNIQSSRNSYENNLNNHGDQRVWPLTNSANTPIYLSNRPSELSESGVRRLNSANFNGVGNNNNLVQPQQQQPMFGNQNFNQRPSSDMQVPLGYKPAADQVQQQQAGRSSLESSLAPSDSSPKISLSSLGQLQRRANQLGPVQQMQQQQKKNSRRRRSINSDQRNDNLARTDEEMSGKYAMGDDEDDDTDSRPMSVVSPDGRPLDSGRIHGKDSSKVAPDRQVAQSQRSANHLEPGSDRITNKPRRGTLKKMKPFGNSRSMQMQAAGSGLMSRLLGTASTNNADVDDELDDDEDNASEKRKEELDDAEFGIADTDSGRGNKQQASSAGQQQQGGGSIAGEDNFNKQQANENNESTAHPSTRRNQQRSDIEFYGHPGEESRQLKYGILGSGNYEVVNGGIYPEADESTAAVNSVANYVRKPVGVSGAGNLLANLPKFLAEHHQRHNKNQQQASDTIGSEQDQLAGFMPGGRMGQSFVSGGNGGRGDEEHLIGMLAHSSIQNKERDEPHLLSSPLLDYIDANGQFQLNSNLLSQLGSSGSSARTVHATQNDDLAKPSKKHSIKSKLTLKSKKKEYPFKSEESEVYQTPIDDLRDREERKNQFNSYQILPSKKVTIFSDQDLDSAPSNVDSLTS